MFRVAVFSFVIIFTSYLQLHAENLLATVDNLRRIHEFPRDSVKKVYLVIVDPVSVGIVSRFGHAVLRISRSEVLSSSDEIIDFYTADHGQSGLIEEFRGLLPFPAYRTAALTPGLAFFRNRLREENRGFTNYEIEFPAGGMEKVIAKINSFIRMGDMTPEFYNWFVNNCASMTARVLDVGLSLQLFGTGVQTPRALPKKLWSVGAITKEGIHESVKGQLSYLRW